MAVLAIVSGVANKVEPDGSFVIAITTPEGRAMEAVIPTENVARFLRAMQESLIHRYASGEGNIYLPEMEVTDINLGHRGTITELMVSTNQISTFMLLLSNEMLGSLADKIGGAILHRSGPKATN